MTVGTRRLEVDKGQMGESLEMAQGSQALHPRAGEPGKSR